ncbi:MAG TPA: efflux RND transporter periplasmic adaptor subunit [Rhizomicrobium sp.]|nr:efflux RND transporter periplasmic adaptor subunit [Rhizomicrobium sp.]
MEKQPIKSLPRDAQLRILAIGATAVAGVLILVPILRETLSAKPEPALPKLVQGGFRPDSAQWANITLGTVTARKFPGLVSVEAQVATDDDTTTQVFSPFTGQVANIAVRAGDHVTNGQVLATVAASEAVQSEGDLIAAQITSRNADANESRQHALYQDGSAALKDWQQAQADQATATGALIAARGRLHALGFGDAQIHAMEMQRKDHAFAPPAELTAPISGTVIQRLVGPGQFVQAGSSNAVFAIGNLDRLWLIGNVREEDATLMRAGEAVDVTVAALPGRFFPARLTWVAAGIDTTTHRLAVRAEIANPGGQLKPAMFATMLIHTGGDRFSPAVPEMAVIREGDQSHVWLSAGGASLVMRRIRPGRLQNGYMEVLGGLTPGDRVALAGSLFLDSAANSD